MTKHSGPSQLRAFFNCSTVFLTVLSWDKQKQQKKKTVKNAHPPSPPCGFGQAVNDRLQECIDPQFESPRGCHLPTSNNVDLSNLCTGCVFKCALRSAALINDTAEIHRFTATFLR